MRPRSLAARIVAGVVAVDLLLVALLVALGVLATRTELLTAFEEGLQSKALSIRALVRYNENEKDPSLLVFDPSGLPVSADPAHPDLFGVYLDDGKVLAQSPEWRGFPPQTEYYKGKFARFLVNDAPYRAVVLREVPILDREEDASLPIAKITVIYASSRLGVRSRTYMVGLYLGVAGVMLLLPMSWLTVWAVRRGLVPLHDLAARAGEITARRWTFEAPTEAQSTRELAALTIALKTLLARLRDSFAAQREFTGDLAHELKTSVAIIKSSTQVLLQNPRSANEYQTGLEGLLVDCERLESLVEKMLRLARVEQWAEEGNRGRLLATDLLPTCEAAVSRVAVLASAKQVTISLEGSPGNSAKRGGRIQLHADPEDLELVWVNLLDNAVRHSAPGSIITLRILGEQSGRTRVLVEDRGEGISPEELPRVFERFHRGDGAEGRPAGGFGLGLAICKAIVEAYGGTIVLESQKGRGTIARVEFPADLAGEAISGNSSVPGN